MKRFSLFSLAGGFGYRKPNHCPLAGLLLSSIIFLPLAFSQTNETLTISTYYPSPYGVYKELRLYPNTSPTACTDLTEGNMYYNSTLKQVMVCKGTGGFPPYVWRTIDSLWILNATNLYPDNTTWNVGIGTSDPQAKLHVVGGMIAVNMGSGLNSQIMGGDGVSSSFMLRNAGTTYSPSGIIITPDKVGIDTYDPKAKLEVVGAAPQFRITGGGTTYKHIELKDSTTNEIWQFSHRPNSEGNRLDTWYYDDDNPAGTAKLCTSITKSGNFGIGQVPGNARLHINSDGIAGAGDYNLFTEYRGNALLVVKNNGNAGLGVTEPNLSKGTGGYLDVKDVYLRDAGKWASASGGGAGRVLGGALKDPWGGCDILWGAGSCPCSGNSCTHVCPSGSASQPVSLNGGWRSYQCITN